MEHDLAAQRLAELGHTTRLAVFRLLVRAGREGLPVGDIQKHLDVAGPTLSHHINRLKGVGLLTQRREGRTLYCVPQMDALRELTGFLESECCTLNVSE
ncbi:ArsR/SmtB family transcription factor [Aliamphritea hakodatensis]|uniref:ArsR/SmtB family transcription factor n=1 Tax=Aliamphritea hakodatensis TaxID=2895352 RepID=UPI0022FD4AF6|nr:metalloregulator ArsR/SmtB family transcription factor [Aliamphritea hakodatensis]